MKNRRDVLLAAGAATAACTVATGYARAKSTEENSLPIRFTLNMSTIRGQKLPISEQIQVAADAGYDGVEPWIGDLQEFVERGGKPNDLGKQIADSGLTVESAIGFAHWIVDDDQARAAGHAQARKDMALVKSIGGARIAAPPVGAHRGESSIPLPVIAERYRTLLEIGARRASYPSWSFGGFRQR